MNILFMSGLGDVDRLSVTKMPATGQKISLYRLLRQLETQENQWNFLREHKLIPDTLDCNKCFSTLEKVYPLSNPGAKFKYFRCPCSPNDKIPVTKETFLYDSHLTPRQYLVIMYGFCFRWKYSSIKREADVEGPDNPTQPGFTKKTLSDKTISFWLEVFRLCVGQEMVSKEANKKIGGPGFEVEIDESLFGSLKYGRGNPYRHRQCWVLGGKCRQTKEVFMEICKDGLRNGDTLKEIILRRVAPGTRIYTDQWKGYYGLNSLGFDWDKEETTVNHSKSFLNPDDPNTHTQGIESNWRKVKRGLPSSGRYKLNQYLPVHCWLDDCDRLGKNRFWELLRIVSERQKSIMAGKWERRRGLVVEDTLPPVVGNTEEQAREERMNRIRKEAEEVVDPPKLFRCFFCGQQFAKKWGADVHQRTCEEK